MTVIVTNTKTKEQTKIENVAEIYDTWAYVYICVAVGEVTIDKEIPKKGHKIEIE